MTSYFNTKNAEILRNRQELRLSFPNIAFPLNPKEGDLPPGVVILHTTLQPEHDPIQYDCVEGQPTKSSNGWMQTWQLVAVPADVSDQRRQAHIAQNRETFKEARAAAVAQIIVDVDGLAFNGDETSQTRMARSVSVMGDEDTIIWVLADNSPALVTKGQLVAALRLAGQRQAELWVQP